MHHYIFLYISARFFCRIYILPYVLLTYLSIHPPIHTAIHSSHKCLLSTYQTKKKITYNICPCRAHILVWEQTQTIRAKNTECRFRGNIEEDNWGAKRMKVLHFIIIVFQLCEQSNYILSVIFLLFNFLTSLCSLNLSSSSTPTMLVFTSLCYPKEWLHLKSFAVILKFFLWQYY